VLNGLQPVERWDFFECRTCGSFEYRHRARRLRGRLTAMLWSCPACDTPIRPHHAFPPFPHVIYHCKLCGLELTLDKKTNKLIVATLPPERVKRERP
jgi:hypothetical protein